MHASTSPKLLFPLALLLVFTAACDQGGSEEKPSGHFEATVSGASDRQLEGTAYSPVAGNALMLAFSADLPDGSVGISLAEIRAPDQTQFGRRTAEYRISPDEPSTEDSLTVEATYEPFCESDTPTGCDLTIYTGKSGVLDVEEIENGVVRGNFSFEAVPSSERTEDGKKAIKVEGSFEAPLRNVEG